MSNTGPKRFEIGGRRSVTGFLLAFGITWVSSCTESNFSGAAGKSGSRVSTGDCKTPPCGPRPPVVLDIEFSGDKKIEPNQNTKIWVVTTDGVFKRFSLDGDKVIVTDTKTWTVDPNIWKLGTGGTRTYVTEGGFLAARFPHLYFIDPDVPNVVESKNIGSNSRTCVASYRKDGKRYIIAAWGLGEYAEYPLDDKPPYKPLWDFPTKRGKITIRQNPPNVREWGYSCFINQEQKIFYSQWYENSPTTGFNLMTYEAVNAIKTTAPNADFMSLTPDVAKYSKGARGGSYALSGDPYGNIYNGESWKESYTAAYDRASDSVWFSNKESPKIWVIDRKCLTTKNTCDNYKDYNPGVVIGPMSALKDGRIVGLVRGGKGDIYILSLSDKNNLKGGLNGVKIGEAGGDPYMYTDFTGATLYITESEQTFKPLDMPKYQASKPIKMAVFSWNPTPAYAAGSLSVEWKNIKLEARCYSNTASKPAYVEIAKVHPSDKGTELNVPSCVEGKYSNVDVRLTQLNNDASLVGIDTVTVGFKQ